MAMLAERSGLAPADLAGVQDDPMAMLLLAASQRGHGADREDELAELEQRASAAEARLEQSTRALQSTATASRALRRYVARVFGTCERCCGLNGLCPACGGQGGPGHQEPDRTELLRWLQPALARAGLTVVTAPDATHPPQGGPTP
jgi:hypothetical protein